MKKIQIIFILNLLIASTAYSVEREPKEIPDSMNQILEVSDRGISPSILNLERAGSSVFFLNNTSSNNLNIEIDYGKKPAFCATGSMEMGKDGVFRSRKPFTPKNFVVVCFPNSGKYPVKVVGRNNNVLRSTIIVK